MKPAHRDSDEVAQTLEFTKSLLKLSLQGRKERRAETAPGAAARLEEMTRTVSRGAPRQTS